jgi:Ca2+-binding RTX toxin-like protein
MPFALEGPKWGDSTYGTRATVTWSFADLDLEPTLAQTYSGYPDFTATISGPFRDLVRGAFATWDEIADIDFVEVADSTASNIRLGEHPIDGRASPGENSTVGTANYWYSGGVFQTVAIEFDVDAFDTTQVFFNTALHEIGHGLGLDHSTAPADVMYPVQNAQNAGGLSVGDMSGARRLYTGGSTFEGGAANDLLIGGAGPDLIVGRGGDDLVRGGDGAELVFGGDGADLVYGNAGADIVYGNVGQDTLYGGQANDALYGGQNDDLIYGNLQNDVLYGGRGNDVLYGGQGNDLMAGGLGDDTLIGGPGADRYFFNLNNGRDLILGFSGAEGDKLDFGGQTYTAVDDGNGGTLFTLSGGGTVDIAGVSPGAVNPSLFA